MLVAMGTRPEAIKLAPVVHALRERSDRTETIVCATAQHREMLDQMMAFFGIRADVDLNLMRPDQRLSQLAANILSAVDAVLERFRPDWVVVQGDTTTAMAVGLAAFHRKLRLAHVEAGLRTGRRDAPFPEEMNRRVISVVADRHFAPTEAARQALLRAGHDPATVLVTGNTVVDALQSTVARIERGESPVHADWIRRLNGYRLLLVTAHRRENFDRPLGEICEAVRDLVSRHHDLVAVYPVHPNWQVQQPVHDMLGSERRVLLLPPLDYPPFVVALQRAHLILTDSGGVQEEASALGRPTLVMREVTERTEALISGTSMLVGTTRAGIVAAAEQVLSDPALHAQMSVPSTAFGDGRAAHRIVESLLDG
jgi:UDP-N-acetylglucosamine 2-epimerase (non-hydrolysing)